MKYILKQKEKPASMAAVRELARAVGVSETLAAILCARGICDEKEARDYLLPSKEQIMDPFRFADMADCVSTVKNVVAKKGRICIYGDYDVDGISGCAVLFLALEKMGARVECVLPSRVEHGYGLSMEAVEAMAGVELLVTVDCGITNVDEIAKAKELGIKTIITDHHECGARLPKADYILNAKRPGETYPYRDLCGAGVALKLACALIGKAAYEYIDIAAVATIADIVPLTKENRVIAALGLKKINKAPNEGLRQLIRAAGVKTDVIDSTTVAYNLAPRINAAGRIANAKTAFDMIVAKDAAKARELADELCKLNADRQQRQERVTAEAMRMEELRPDDKLILLYKPDWDVGIIGLAASKVAERYNRPTVLLGKAGDSYVGSARSIGEVNIYEALRTQQDLYEKFGGHSGAAGLTIKEEHIETVKRRVNQFLAQTYTEEVFRPVRYYDMALRPGEITPALIKELEKMQPFGHKNEQAEILIRGAEITGVRAIGDDKHARFGIKKKGGVLNAVRFSMQAADIPPRADVIGTLQMNSFDGLPQMIVSTLSFEPAAGQTYTEARDALLAGNAGKEFFLGREKLLAVYTVLRGIARNGMAFNDIGALLAFMQKHVDGLTVPQAAFAFLVLEQIDLLELKKGDKISVAVRSEKHELAESEIYRKFATEEKEDGFESQDQEH